MSRSGRFERIERQRPPGSSPAASRPGLGDRFGPADAAPATGGAGARSQTTPERFESEPPADGSPRLLELDDGQPFVRCARCHADGHRTATACAHCGADLTTLEQRAYNETYWRQRQADAAEQRAELARLQTARETAERELAEATRELRRRTAERRTLDEEVRDPFRATARALGRRLGTWLRRAFPNRTHRIGFAILAALGLVVLIAAYPTQAWGALWALVILAALVGWFRRLVRLFRE